MDLSAMLNKNKNKVFGLAIILLSFMVAYRIYEWQALQLKLLNDRIVEENKKNQVLTDISKLEGEVEVYRKLLTKNDASSMMSDINNIARDTGVKIISIRPSGENASPEYTKYMFDLSVEAPDYNTLAKFVNKLETFERVYLVEVSNIESPFYNKDKELRTNLRISAVVMLN